MSKFFFEDEHLKVYLKLERKSSYTLITFSDMTFASENGDFFASKPTEQLSINVIGFVARSRNWYPKASVSKAVEKLRRANSEIFVNVITYGGSMGGYAAIKYSNLLSAKKVVAYVPQWSIEPDNLIGDQRFVNYYCKNSLGGQSILNPDICGDIFIFYDPLHELDSKNIEMIEKTAEYQVKKIKLFNSGHHATSILAGTNNFKEILKLVYANDFNGLNKFCFIINKRHDLRLRIVIEKALIGHPFITSKILEKIKLNLESYPERFRRFIEKK